MRVWTKLYLFIIGFSGRGGGKGLQITTVG
jgi:hypothetical protein